MKNALYSILVMGLTAVSTAALLFVGCDSPDKLDQGGGGGVAGTVVIKLDAASGNGAAGGGGNTGPLPTGDANCGSVTSSANHMPADVLLVLDRSGSMSLSISEDCYCDQATRDASPGGNNPLCSNTSNCTNRWATVTSALNTTLTATPEIRWGLKLFSSSGSGCTVNNGVEVAISPTAASSIQDRIRSTSPGGNTPTAQAMTTATAYLRGVNDPNNKVILLATDGEPNCASSGSSTSNVPATIDAIEAAQAAGFPVYVIGIGPSVGNLDNFAVAGGTQKSFPATSPAELASALAAISTAVTTCTFTLSLEPGADLDNVAVYLDKRIVAKNDTNGWSFGAGNQTVVLNGDACEKVKSGAASQVEILVGCEGVRPPDIIP